MAERYGSAVTSAEGCVDGLNRRDRIAAVGIRIGKRVRGEQLADRIVSNSDHLCGGHFPSIRTDAQIIPPKGGDVTYVEVILGT